MTIDDLRRLYDREQRIAVAMPTMRREEVDGVIRHVDLAGRSSSIIYAEVSAARLDDVIRHQQAYFRGLGHEVEWKVFSHDLPATLPERLAAHGFAPDQMEALMILDLEEAPPALLRPPAHEIQRVSEPEGLARVVAVQDAVWQSDHAWLAGSLAAEMRADPRAISIYIAVADGVVASTAWIRFDAGGRFASLWGGSTLAGYRKRGLYRDLLAVRVQEARGRGARFLTIDAGPMSRPIVERSGFRFVSETQPWVWRP